MERQSAQSQSVLVKSTPDTHCGLGCPVVISPSWLQWVEHLLTTVLNHSAAPGASSQGIPLLFPHPVSSCTARASHTPVDVTARALHGSPQGHITLTPPHALPPSSGLSQAACSSAGLAKRFGWPGCGLRDTSGTESWGPAWFRAGHFHSL